MNRVRIAAAAAVVSFAALSVNVGGADDALAATCPPPPTTVYPFTPWGDARPYVPATGGSFEANQPAWTLSGGAAVVNDNEPFHVNKSTDSRALYLPPGSSATSACVTAPGVVGVVRFFARNSGVAGGQLRVDILVKGGVYPAGTISAANSWTPTPILASTAPAYSGAVTYQIRLTPIGAGAAFTVDDVYFDPFKGR